MKVNYIFLSMEPRNCRQQKTNDDTTASESGLSTFDRTVLTVIDLVRKTKVSHSVTHWYSVTVIASRRELDS